MLSFLKQPYVFAAVCSVLTAALAAVLASYTRPADTDKSKVFYKTLAAALVASLTLTYLVNRGPEPVATEPFIDPMAAAAAVNPLPTMP